jgi:putative RNA 2'-phosphotransferase
MNKQLVKSSRFLSLVLRHRPETVGVMLDAEGWVAIDDLLAACTTHGHRISPADLAQIVAENDKQRFVVRDGRIRANQGHSIDVDLALAPATPPATLFHGTATRFVADIWREGLRAMARQHVHLSAGRDTADRVGRRHGRPVILAVDAAGMAAAGMCFYRSENGVWLTAHVPPQFLMPADS